MKGVDDFVANGWKVVDTDSKVISGEWRYFESNTGIGVRVAYVETTETVVTLKKNGSHIVVRSKGEVEQNAS